MLHQNLKSLEAQDLSLIDDVHIVENGSDEIRDLSCYRLPLKLTKLSKGNRSAARNQGAQNAKSSILVFLDSDVVIEAGWLSGVLNSFEANTLAVQTSIIPEAPKSNLLQKIRKSRTFFRNEQSFLSLKKDNLRKVVLNSSAFAVRAEVFHSLGGFDEALTRQEDLDFTQRLLRLEGEIKAISRLKCKVYYQSDLFHYFFREFNSGFHVVRFHDKWSSKNLSDGYQSLKENTLAWLTSLGPETIKQPVDLATKGLELTYLAGNLAGILKKTFRPYPGKKVISSPVKAKLVLE